MTSEPITIELLHRSFGVMTTENARALRDSLNEILDEYPLANLCPADLFERVRNVHPEWLARPGINNRVLATCHDVARKWESEEVDMALDYAIEVLEEEFADEDKAA